MLVAINPSVKQRESKWVCVCPNCQHERIISYSQKWNIETNKSKKECRLCQIELGLITINMDGLKIGRDKFQDKASKSRTGIKREKSKDVIKYRKLFNETSFTSEETRKKQSNAKLGKTQDKANNWQGGLTKERILLTSRLEYKNLRKKVFARDNFCCQICNNKKELQMDHIKEWCNYPELRYEMTNLRTLCKPCHKKTDNFASKAIRRKHELSL